jgi:hypothetical protein
LYWYFSNEDEWTEFRNYIGIGIDTKNIGYNKLNGEHRIIMYTSYVCSEAGKKNLVNVRFIDYTTDFDISKYAEHKCFSKVDFIFLTFQSFFGCFCFSGILNSFGCIAEEVCHSLDSVKNL